MNSLKFAFFISFCLVLLSEVYCSPKKYDQEEGGFAPSHRYYESNLPNSSNQNNKYNNNRYNSTSSNQNRISSAESKVDKESRFGIVYGTSGNGGTYGNGVSYAPMKIDIGGVALGALIGLGAILIVPKLANILSGAHGYRSLDNEMSSVTEILSRIDNSLEQHHIDSTSCMQRIICTYVNDATKNHKNGESGALDEFILGFTSNSLFSYLLDGTAIKKSVEMGQSGDTEKCSSLYPKCPLSKENVLKVISSLLPA